MSGLAALFHRDGRPVDRDTVWAMLAAVPYRGPDGSRIRCDGAVALGHARMLVTPEERSEWQPLVSPRSGCILAADVRLDNRADLLARLRDAPATISDAEILLRSYETRGLDALADLLGDFAFVLWDPRSQCLICARDTSGQRGLFYRVDAHTFAAASEIHQLLLDPAVPVRPNDAYLRERLVPLHMFRNEKDAADTYFQGIYRVPAGHVLVVDSHDVQVRPYWTFELPGELCYRRDEEYAEHFRELFFEVLATRLRSTRPIGALLSGGLDSSSIVCAAQQLYQAGRAESHGFISFSAVFGHLACDEEELIRDIQQQYGFEACYVPCADAGSRLEVEPSGFLETPNTGATGMRNALCLAATERGVRVLLSGEIADSCIGGSRLVFDSLLRRGDLRAFHRHFQAYRRVSNEPWRTTVAFACLAPLLPLPLHRSLQVMYARRACARNGGRWLPGWMPEHLRSELSRRHLSLWEATERGRRFANPTREAEYNLLYPPEVTRHPSPWPIEVWRPFADRRLHQFLLAIPPEKKFDPHPETDEFYAGSKQVLRQATRGIVPDSVRARRSKTVFQAQMQSEVASNWRDYEAAFGPSASPEIAARGFVERHAFWARLNELRAGDQGPDRAYVVAMIGIETWLRALNQPRSQFVAAPSPPVWQQRRAPLHREEAAAARL